MELNILRRITTSTAHYKIALVIAVFLLLFIASINYKQLSNLEKSAYLVSQSFLVDKEINNLFSQYSLMESAEFRSVILRDSTFADSYIDYKLDSDKTLKNLYNLTRDVPEHQASLDSVTILKDKLHNTLIALHGKVKTVGSDSTVLTDVQMAASFLRSLRSIKAKMLLKKESLLQERLSAYRKQTILTPLTSLFLALFSLAVFTIAFINLRRHKNQIQSSEALLQNIIQSTDNIMNYYEPIYDEGGEIVDFKIIFANECNHHYLGLDPEKIVGKSISKVFPFLLLNGELEEMIASFKKNETIEFERQVILNKEKFWFDSIIKPLENGILVVIRNKTEEQKAFGEVLDLNEQLQLQNTIFKDAESVAEIGSYIWYLDNGEAVISDNFYRILGHEPNAFKVTYESYREFVHPDDIEIYNILGQETKQDGKSKINQYRIVSKDGTIKHLQLKGHSIQKDGRPVSLGVVQDISSLVKTEKILNAKNLELKKSNEELESFNRIASHDLQEPLRKIQMFISRFDEVEKSELSEKGKGYFEKICTAAARMQSLIRNLLAYSRIDSSHVAFETVDLNLILNKIQEDYVESISETNTIIVSEKLPTIQGVFFQMEQLFSNLITNAIKYRDPKLPPKIVLKSEKVHYKQIPETFLKNSKHYYKISIIDNGIGFANENAIKIFEVFQRLHQKTKYSGTGIGLAICKKIVDNHHGFIHATSEFGKGSAFIIYLPA
ncbi:PAS domain-containing protein [Aurantibacter crassamenti]|uniref:ATP-binding protein n=1 Tax=Aurantibacter crassamenti TaxID=1837375 RepID=UPI00193943BB|nr:ATP-binding protein [Aurantibacter crassamenti]MBM1105890.1 PAS domain-containing protein [Aurantibacter crassamenti]